MDEIEPPGPNVGPQVRYPAERGNTPDPNPLDSEAFKREANLLIAKRGKRGDDAGFLHLAGKIEQRPLGATLSERVDNCQDVEFVPALLAVARACGVN
jgi:hypothetical protein